MSHQECHDDSCSSQHHCECCCDSHAECKCSCHEGQQECCFSDQLLEMADEAWMELLKEKIKQKIEAATGDHLDQLATIVSSANHERWNTKMSASKSKDEYKAKIAEFFNR